MHPHLNLKLQIIIEKSNTNSPNQVNLKTLFETIYIRYP